MCSRVNSAKKTSQSLAAACLGIWFLNHALGTIFDYKYLALIATIFINLTSFGAPNATPAMHRTAIKVFIVG